MSDKTVKPVDTVPANDAADKSDENPKTPETKDGFFKKLARIPKKIHNAIGDFAEEHPRLNAMIGTAIGIGIGVGGKILFDKYRGCELEDEPVETEFVDDEYDEPVEEETEAPDEE